MIFSNFANIDPLMTPPKDGSGSAKKGKIFLKVRNVIEMCEKILQNNVNSIDVIYNLGKCYIEVQDYFAAQNIIDMIEKDHPDHVFFYILNGHLNIKKGQLINSYKSFLKAYLKIQNKDPFLVYGIGLLFEHIEKYTIATKWYTHLLKYDIELFKYCEILYRIGVAYKKNNKLIDARETFKTLLDFSRSDAFNNDIKIQLAHIYERMSDTDKCLEILDEIKGTYVKKIPLYRMYAWAYYRKNEFAKLKALEENQECFDPYVLYLIARAYLEDKNYQKAVSLLYASIKLDNQMFMAYNTLGVVYYTTKNAEKSFLYFHKAVEINFEFSEAVENLRVVEENNRKYNPSVSMKETTPNLIKTRYLDSQVIFFENIYYATSIDSTTIQEMTTFKMENL